MELGLMLKAVLLLGVSFKLADSFFVPITGRWHSTSASCCPSRSYCSTGRGVARPSMMAGFGGNTSKKPKEKPALVGAGKGQKVYERQMRSFTGLAGAGADVVDVYVYEQNSDDDKFVFAGKVAWSSEVTMEQALQWHRDLIVNHVKLLEPKIKPPLRIFTAPGNSEVEVARNIHDLKWVLGGKGSVSVEGVKNAQVGYKPELYEPGDKYFYVRRLPDGKSPEPPAEIMVESLDKMVNAGVIPPPAA